MKVLFLDFDGVLNSQASFCLETRKRKAGTATGPVNQTLCHICTNNFQMILEECPDVKIVISSTWRNSFSIEFLKEKLTSYGIDASRVIGVTPKSFNRPRGHEIGWWLEDHPEVTDFVIVDDNSDMGEFMDKLVKTEWEVGLTYPLAKIIISRLWEK